MIALPPLLAGGLHLAVAETVPPATPLTAVPIVGAPGSPPVGGGRPRGRCHRIGEGRLRSHPDRVDRADPELVADAIVQAGGDIRWGCASRP